jgi:two-component system nitrate/nitrite response regulator NarL
VKRSVTAIVVEPRTLVREGLVSLLHDSDFRVISAVPTFDQVPEAALARAGLLTVGASHETAEAFEHVNKNSPGTRRVKIVVVAEISGKVPQSDILKFLHAGADCCIVNVRSRDILLKAMHLAVLGQLVVVVGQDSVSGDAMEADAKSNGLVEPGPLVNGGHAAQLSAREAQILKFIVAGHSNKVIARSCKLAESTVKIHLKAILRKICVRNRTQAAIWAVQHSGSGGLCEQAFASSPEQSACRPIQVERAAHVDPSVIDLAGELNGKSPPRR